ncbi:MAG: YbaB/EbfC family nucleoid-associated protein [Schaalia odontolytica]
MAEAEKRAADARELVDLIKNAKASGFDSRREVEVEVDPNGRLMKLSIDDAAIEDADARDVEDAIMEAYADAGRNMRDYIHRQTTERFGDDGGTMKDYLNNVDANLGSLGR